MIKPAPRRGRAGELILVVVVALSFPTLKSLDVGIADAIAAQTGIIASTVLDTTDRIRIALWTEMPFLYMHRIMCHNSLLIG